jgi:hypothetical protein
MSNLTEYQQKVIHAAKLKKDADLAKGGEDRQQYLNPVPNSTTGSGPLPNSTTGSGPNPTTGSVPNSNGFAMPTGGSLPRPTDNSSYIRSVYDEQSKAQTSALHGARDQANSDYQEKIDSAPQEFQPHRDQVDRSTVQGIQRANAVAAAKGIAFSGGLQSNQGGMHSAGEAQKTALTSQEINLVQSLKKAIADNNRNTSFKEVEMRSNNQSQMHRDLIGEKNRIYEGNYRAASDSFNQGIMVSGLTGYYGNQRTLQGQQIDSSNQQWQENMAFQKGRADVSDSQWDKSMDRTLERDRTSDTQWDRSMEFQKDRANTSDRQWDTSMEFQKDRANTSDRQWDTSMDFQRERANTSDRQWDTSMNFQRERANSSDSQWRESMDRTTNRDNVSDSQWRESMDRTTNRDNVSDSQWRESMDRTTNRDSVSDSQWKASMDFQKDRAQVADGQWLKSLNSSNANAAAGRAIQWNGLALDKEKFDWAKSPDNPNNIMSASSGSQAYKDTLKTSLDLVGQTKKVVDPETGGIKEVPKNDKSVVMNFVYNDPTLSTTEKLQMLKQLGYK